MSWLTTKRLQTTSFQIPNRAALSPSLTSPTPENRMECVRLLDSTQYVDRNTVVGKPSRINAFYRVSKWTCLDWNCLFDDKCDDISGIFLQKRSFLSISKISHVYVAHTWLSRNFCGRLGTRKIDFSLCVQNIRFPSITDVNWQNSLLGAVFMGQPVYQVILTNQIRWQEESVKYMLQVAWRMAMTYGLICADVTWGQILKLNLRGRRWWISMRLDETRWYQGYSHIFVR